MDDEDQNDTTPLQPQLQDDGKEERVNRGGTFKTSVGTVLTCIGCMVGTGNIWRFPRILANNSGEEGCLQFILIWVMFLFLWSIPIILIEYGMGRFTKKGTVGAFQELLGPYSAWAGGWTVLVDFGISGYYSVIVGWCLYYLFYFMVHDLPEVDTNSTAIFDDFTQESSWPVLCHTIAIILAGVTVLWGAKSIEMFSSVVVSSFLVLIVVCFIWSLTLPNAIDGIRFIFTPDWAMLGGARIWVDAISQNAFDTGAAAGLFVSYSAYMTAQNGIVRYGYLIPVGNNIVSLLCGMLTYATVFSTQMNASPPKNQSEIVKLLGENGPGNTGLTFIWFPIFFDQIAGGRALCILFFIALLFAGFSSLVANVELFVKTLVDWGAHRVVSTVICSTALFLLGLGSAFNLNFLVNQDFVWGFGLLVSGIMFLYCVIRYGAPRFRKQMFNDYSIKDWHLYPIWDYIVWFLAPIEVAVLIVWWAVDTIINAEPGVPWYGFSPESFMATIVQWVGGLVILISLNLIIVGIILPRRRRRRRRDESSASNEANAYFNDGMQGQSNSKPYMKYQTFRESGTDSQPLVKEDLETSY